MRKLPKYITDKKIYEQLQIFLEEYGEKELIEALNLYTNLHQKYLCKTKTSISQIYIHDIYYMKIHGHNIEIHTAQEIYFKYGSLSQELKLLSKYGFIRCSQNCIVCLEKIKKIQHDDIILLNGRQLHISRSCIPNVLMMYSQKRNARE